MNNSENLVDLSVNLNGREQAILRAALSFAFSNVSELNEALQKDGPNDFNDSGEPVYVVEGDTQTTEFSDNDFNNLSRKIFGNGLYGTEK